MLKVNTLTGFGVGGSGPLITSSSSITVVEGALLSFSIVTDRPSTLSIAGSDSSNVELVSNALLTTHTLRWVNDGTRDPDTPSDANSDNVYEFTATPTDSFGNEGKVQNVAITVDYDWGYSQNIALDTDSAGWNGYTIRQVLSGNLLVASGSKVRLLLVGGTAQGFTVDALWIGEKASSGDAYDMKSSSPSPAQFTVNGSTIISVGIGSQSVWTDALAFHIDESKDYVVGMHFSAISTVKMRLNFYSLLAAYNKAGVNEASTANVSGYTTMSSTPLMLISAVQVANDVVSPFNHDDTDTFHQPTVS